MKKVLILTIFLLQVSVLSAHDFYVSLSGNDEAAGTKSQPWRTPVVAVRRTLDFMRNHPGKAVRLIIRGGEYELSENIVIDGKELNAPLSIIAKKGEEVTFCGDRRLTDWAHVSEPRLLALWNKECADKVLQTDLRKAGIQDLGKALGTGNRVDLYYNGKRQTLARWPNKGFTEAGRAVGKTDCPPSWIKIHGTKEGFLEYNDARIARWASEDEPCAFGYWYWDWSDGYHAIEKIDSHKKTFSFAPPYHVYGYRDGCRYYGLNLLCELDSIGEYYIDRRSGILYWYPPEEFNPAEDQVRLSCLSGPMMIQVKNMDGFVMNGITLRSGRGGGVEIAGGKNCLLKDCNLLQLAQTALSIHEGKGHRVEGCLLQELGHGGITIRGGNSRTLESSEFVITNTTVRDFSLYQRTYQPAVLMEGVGFTVSHCRFEGSSSSAMRIEANNSLIEYNQVFDVVKESDDQGGIDMFFNYARRGNVIRYNHWRDITGSLTCGAAGVRFDDIISGQTVYGNVFENVGGTLFGGVQIHGGKDNTVENNLFYNCPRAVSFTPWSDETWEANFNRPDHQKRIFEEVDIRSEIYLSRYPELREPYKAHHNRNFIRNNLAVQCPELFHDEKEENELENNTLLPVQEDAPKIDYYLKPAVLKQYGLKPIPFQKIGLQKQK